MLLGRLRSRLGALITVAGLVILGLTAYQLDFIAPTSRLGLLLGLTSTPYAPLEPVDYTAAVVYLVERRRMNDIPHSLGEAQRHIPWRRQWPIILFHTGDYDTTEAQQEFFDVIRENEWSRDVYEALRKRIEFVKLEFKLPPGMPEDKSVYKPQVSEDKWPGYQHMCRFYAQQIFHHPRLRNLTYYLRLDTDSFIVEPLCYDPIHRIHANNRVYAYNRITPDEGYVVRGMWNLIDRYAKAHPEVEARLAKNKWPWPKGREDWVSKGVVYDGIGVPAYSNNFEIVKLEAFQRPDVVAWIEEIMADPDRIYSLRWGDAPIRGATISMFFDKEKDIERICAMEYWHQGAVHQDCTCIP